VGVCVSVCACVCVCCVYVRVYVCVQEEVGDVERCMYMLEVGGK